MAILPSTFQTPVASGITPGGQLGAQLSAITRRAFVPSLFVQIYQSHPLLSLLISKAKVATGGIGQITLPIQTAQMHQFSWGDFTGNFSMPEDTAAIQSATFNLKMGLVPVGFYGFEALVQGDEAHTVIPKLRASMSDAAVVIKQALAQSLYTNNASNANALDSLVQAYDDGTNVPSYGGVTRINNTSWQGQYKPNRTGISNRAGIAQMILEVQSGAGGESPDFIAMNPANFATLISDYIAVEHFEYNPNSMPGGQVANSGFTAIKVLGVPVFPDPFCPLGEMYAINTKYLSLYMHKNAAFTFSGFNSTIAQGQVAEIGVLLSALNLVCAKPSSGARVTGLGSNAWGSLPTPPALSNII